MRKITTGILIAVVLVIVLFESGVIDSLLVFLLSGSIPGTPITLTPSMMMALLAVSAWLLLARLTAFNARVVRRHLHRRLKKQKHMPKRRYSRI